MLAINDFDAIFVELSVKLRNLYSNGRITWSKKKSSLNSLEFQVRDKKKRFFNIFFFKHYEWNVVKFVRNLFHGDRQYRSLKNIEIFVTHSRREYSKNVTSEQVIFCFGFSFSSRFLSTWLDLFLPICVYLSQFFHATWTQEVVLFHFEWFEKKGKKA